ncbi:MAG TPA: hypothetical protein VI356_08285 [Myxococcales bacterium]
MQSFSWLAALALSLAVPAPSDPSPAKEPSAPTKHGEDRPAHESPYSAFGAPHAKRAPAKKRSGPRVHCNDGTIQTVGQKGDRSAVCSEHGGVKEKAH